MRKLGRIAAWLAFVVLPIPVAVGAFFLGAWLTGRVGPPIVLAILAAGGVGFGFVRLALGRRRPAVIAGASMATLFVAIGWYVAFRSPPRVSRAMPDRGVKFTLVDLSTGSRVAVARLEEGRSKVPVVFLHGGPGRPTTVQDITFFRGIAAEGLDVILFDQAGVGESPRLPRNEISLDRAIRDLEALREKLALPSMMLVGQSWGARLAYEYTARHPDRVARLVVTGGAPLTNDPSEWQFDERRTGVAHGKPGPFPGRFLTYIALMKTNPSAADAFVHDEEELDAMMASVVPTIQLRSVCTKDGPSIKPAVMTGLDGTQFVALRPFIENASAPAIGSPPPSLVLRAECDFAQWRTARAYRDRLHAKVVVVEGAGHAIWPLRADAARPVLASFLRDGSLSRAPYEGDDDPAR